MDNKPPQAGDAGSRDNVLRATSALSGDAAAIALARDFAAAFLSRAGQADARVRLDRCRDVVLVVSELVTNAVRHAPGPCALTLELTGLQLVVAVTDTSPQRPTPQPIAPQRLGGHGLEIVLALSTSLHSRGTQGGKAVLAVMTLA